MVLRRVVGVHNWVGVWTWGLAMTLAMDAACADVVAVVSAKRAATALSNSQLADIFLGKVARFPDGSKAVPLDQAEDNPVHDEFYLKITGKSAAQIRAFWSKSIFTGRGEPPKTVTDGVEMKKRIAANPDIIGYIDEKLVDDSVRVVR